MSKSKLHCSVITPERKVLDADVDSVILPAHDGLIGVQKGRAPLLCEVGIGILRLREGANAEQEFFVDGGFAQVIDNEVTILTTRARKASEIKPEEARQALESARAMEVTDDDSFEARQKAIARAETQLKLVG